jgi:hypothetical protein
MFPLLMTGQIVNPSNGVLTWCVCVSICKEGFLKCCYKVNMILKVTKNRVFVLKITVINCLGFLHINM